MSLTRKIVQPRHGSVPLLGVGAGYSWFRRALNAAVLKVQTRFDTVNLLAMPTHYAIEVTNRCDGGCRLCPVGQGRRSRPQGLMPWDRFVRVLDQIDGRARFVGLYNWGEPFEHPRIYEMISEVHRRRIYAKLSSNMHAFRTEDSEQLVRTGLDDLGVSIHGLSEQSCRAYRPRCQFAEVIEKVKALVATRRRLASRTPAIHLNLIATHHNEHELGALPAFAATLGVGYWIQKTSLNLRMLPFDRRMNPRGVSEEVLQEERLALIEEWLPRDDAQVQDYYKYVRLHEGRFPPREEKWFRCTSPWNQMFVCWDGDVNLCCGSFEKRHSVGNVAEQPLHEIWNNALYHAARRAARGRPFATDPPVLCRECPGALL